MAGRGMRGKTCSLYTAKGSPTEMAFNLISGAAYACRQKEGETKVASLSRRSEKGGAAQRRPPRATPAACGSMPLSRAYVAMVTTGSARSANTAKRRVTVPRTPNAHVVVTSHPAVRFTGVCDGT